MRQDGAGRQEVVSAPSSPATAHGAAPAASGDGLGAGALSFLAAEPTRQAVGPGARRTASVLAGVAGPGWYLFHNLIVPGRRSCLDHLVVTPAGVVAIESRHWWGTVWCADGTIWVSGRPRYADVARLRRTVETVSGVLAFETRQTVPVVGAVSLTSGRPNLAVREVGDLVVARVEALASWLRGRADRLSPYETEGIAIAVVHRFRTLLNPTCYGIAAEAGVPLSAGS
jgi:hypothetical protein